MVNIYLLGKCKFMTDLNPKADWHPKLFTNVKYISLANMPLWDWGFFFFTILFYYSIADDNIILVSRVQQSDLYFIYFKIFYLFIYLTVSGLSCRMQSLPCSAVGSLVVACGLSCHMACEILVPQLGVEHIPLQGRFFCFS